MPVEQFELTVRRKDILEIYQDDISFRLISTDNFGRLFFSILFLILTCLSAYASFYDKEFLFFTLLFACALIYAISRLKHNAAGKKKKKNDTISWIDSF